VWVKLVVGGAAVVVVGVLSVLGLWLRRSLAGAVSWPVWMSLVAEVVLFR
jgi:hypothetical protein